MKLDRAQRQWKAFATAGKVINGVTEDAFESNLERMTRLRRNITTPIKNMADFRQYKHLFKFYSWI